MKKPLFLLAAILLCPCAQATKKPKMVVQVYAVDWHFESLIEIVDAYLILPDGTHVHGTCMSGFDSPCVPESFTPEKRSPAACSKTEGKPNAQHCVYQENYYADRKGNDLTLYAANGKVTFHIVSSWDMDALAGSR
jgi:hypothetical protein